MKPDRVFPSAAAPAAPADSPPALGRDVVDLAIEDLCVKRDEVQLARARFDATRPDRAGDVEAAWEWERWLDLLEAALEAAEARLATAVQHWRPDIDRVDLRALSVDWIPFAVIRKGTLWIAVPKEDLDGATVLELPMANVINLDGPRGVEAIEEASRP